ncbi:MAG: D-tyrosyl-tRNA(Tyr) deacylase [Deltaproteobacteria bacterium]|nr:D-tyrosyl-tRNA(Tyr) deacylase [Deltaproteobacteria bacterium]
MRIVIQRVSRGSVSVVGEVVGKISQGLVVLVGVEKGDSEKDVDYLTSKVSGMRIFANGEGKMDLSVNDIGGGILAVSQFTLLANTRKGRRPSFEASEDPKRAEELFDLFVAKLRDDDLTVETGRFGADMRVEIIGDGPLTIVIDSRE